MLLIQYSLVSSGSTSTNSHSTGSDEAIIRQNGKDCWNKSDNSTTYCLVRFNISEEYHCMDFNSDFNFIFNRFSANVPYLKYENRFNKVKDIQCGFEFDKHLRTCGENSPENNVECRQHSDFLRNSCCFIKNLYDNSTYCGLNPNTLYKKITMNGIFVDCSSSFLVLKFIFILILIF
jgi:hypothetical protein